MMNSKVIRQLVLRRPFEPFTVHLSEGESYEVRHPETVALGRQRIVVVDPDSDQMAICSLLHVTSVETLQSA
jgi:hypothetical protein